jgi:hypothetical protein
MRRIWIYVLSLTILLTLVSADALAAKRSRGASSHARAKRQSKGKHAAAKLSRRDKRARGRVATRGKRGRRIASSRRSRRRTQYVQAIVDPVTPRPSSGISLERATEIQNALIKAGYLDGPASGQYDEATIEAMKDFQAANKLPATGLPSAPALKKLGVPKRSSDGYAVPVNKVSETDKKQSPQ